MIHDLMKQFSSNQAYHLFNDVNPFFGFLKTTRSEQHAEEPLIEWPWKSTTVGIITNSDPRVPSIIRSLRLSVRREEDARPKSQADISFITMSYNVGVEKPNARIFQAAEKAFAQLPLSSRIMDADLVKVHVGDDMEKDTFGAMNAGWDAIFLDREEKFRDEWKTAGTEKTTISITAKGREVTVIKDLSALELWD
jgi:hypothetical protein